VGTLSTSLQAFKGRAALFITCLGSELATLPQTITKLAHFEYTCDDLTENDRLLFSKFIQKHYDTNFDLQWLADSIRVLFKSLSLFTFSTFIKGLMLSELNQLLNEAIVCANKNSRHQLHQSDFDWALEQRNKAFGESIGVPKIPTVTWNDVGGLDDVKQLISESLRANLNPNRSPNMRRSGIVLWGAPGCGKTLIAKGLL
jgi:SpoVK/Ycf46/Vps4 family AAA+-type ATPase